MDQQDNTRTAGTRRAQPVESAEPLETSSSLADQAQGWGDIARRSLDDCQRGLAAEQEVQRRRNEPGQ